MTPIIQCISIGKPRTILHDGRDVETGIYKSPVDGPVRVTELGIAGDGQADLSVHGGRDKAVYAYPLKHYPTWAVELGVTGLEDSQFGENLAVTEIDEDRVCIGDRFRFGSVVAVVAQPRLPCFKLGIRMGDPDFPPRFLQSGRLGIYLRVETEGETQAGDEFELVEQAAHGISVTRLWRCVFGKDVDRELARQCLEVMPHLDEGWRRRLRVRAVL